MEEIKITAINKIKINPDKTAVINYAQSDDLTSAEITFKGKDKVTEAFYNKFQENVEGLIASIPILGEDKFNLTMNIIKFVYNEDKNIESIQYAAKYSINSEDDKADIVTPLLAMELKFYYILLILFLFRHQRNMLHEHIFLFLLFLIVSFLFYLYIHLMCF